MATTKKGLAKNKPNRFGLEALIGQRYHGNRTVMS